MDRNPADAANGLPIAPDDLSPEALRGIVEEFVTRDGTELSEASLKIDQVLARLRAGHAQIWFDETTRTCNILRADR